MLVLAGLIGIAGLSDTRLALALVVVTGANVALGAWRTGRHMERLLTSRRADG
jgi:hypothetical protein